MHIRNLDLNLLRSFLVVYEQQSITKAAQKLNLSQPAVSNAMIRLGKTLGLTLFVREGRALVPTAPAHYLYENLNQCLATITTTVNCHLPFNAKQSRRIFRIFAPSLEHSMLKPGLQLYCREHAPMITLEFVNSEQCHYADLVPAQAELYLQDQPGEEQQLRHELLCHDKLVLLTGPCHPPLPEVIGPDRLESLTLIDYAGHTYYLHKRLLQRFWRDDLLRCHCLADALLHIHRYPRALLASWQASQPWIDVLQLKAHIPGGRNSPSQKIALYLCWHEMNDRDPGLLWLREAIKSLMTSNSFNAPSPCAEFDTMAEG
ncbi:MAG: LysR family transcriptional regulator [Methylococcales bacterium]|nr:LysR family transcriptional regulator [Methylococcales bacterium]